MIDPVHPAASWFLWIAGGLFLVVFAIPLLWSPLRWARAFGWPDVQASPLTGYFGRCVGALGAGLVIGGFRAAPRPGEHLILFDVIIASGVLLGLVHVRGALRRDQPLSETLEIALYFGLSAVAFWMRGTLLEPGAAG